MSIDEIKQDIKNRLDEQRYIHSINVMETAKKLASHYGEDAESAALAGLLHDCGKNIKGDKAISLIKKIGYEPDQVEYSQPGLLHGRIGAYFAECLYGVEDEEILNAIRWHTVGRRGMGIIEKIIYISDYIEPARNLKYIEPLRVAAYEDINICLLKCVDCTIKYIISKGTLIHHNSIDMHNEMVLAVRSNRLC